jgi:hypothetical protein
VGLAQTFSLCASAVYAIDSGTAGVPECINVSIDSAQLKPDAADAAHQLAHQTIEALGGIEKVRYMINAMTLSTGQMTDFSAMSGAANTVQIELLSQKDKYRIELNVLGQKAVTGFNGKVAWQQHGEDIFPSDPITTKKVAQDSNHGTILFLRLDDPLVQMKLLPEKEVQGKKCLGLEIIADDGKPTDLFIDPDNHMILSMEYMGTDFEQGTEAPKRVELADFRPVLGTIMPFKSIEYTGDKKTSEELIKSIEIKNDIPATVFDMPPRKPVQGLGREPVVIPFEYLSNEVVVKAKVNDKAELRFLLDTGATQNVMERKSATAFGAIAKSDMSLTTGSGFVTMGGIVLQSLQIGDIKLTDVPMAVADMPGFSQISPVRPAGIIGANILRRFAVTVDYEQRKVYFCDPEKVVVPDGAILLTAEPALGSGGLSVNGLLDGKLKIRLLVDTGAAFNSISEPLIKPVLDYPLLHVGSVEGVDGFKVSVGAVQLNKLCLDQLIVDAPIFSVAPGAADSKMPVGLLSASSLGILGNPFWSHFRLTVDYLNGRVILEQSKTSSSTLAILHDLREALVNYHKDRNCNDAVAALDKLLLRAQSSDLLKVRTIVTLARAQIIGEKVTSLKPDDLLPVVKNFDAAFALAKENNDPVLEARVMAQEALFLLDHQPGYIETRNINQLLRMASMLANSEPDLLVAGAVFCGNEAPATRRKMIDQALVQDPTNWRGLIEKYLIAKKDSKPAEGEQVLALLRHYYPGCDITVATATATSTATSTSPSSSTTSNSSQPAAAIAAPATKRGTSGTTKKPQ